MTCTRKSIQTKLKKKNISLHFFYEKSYNKVDYIIKKKNDELLILSICSRLVTKSIGYIERIANGNSLGHFIEHMVLIKKHQKNFKYVYRYCN